MILLFNEYANINDDNFHILFEKLPDKRQRKALNFRNSGGRISCVTGYLLFLYGFRKIYNQNGSPEFAYGKNGKPYLKDYSDIFFNISHCNGAAACIFGNSPVGIDIQDVREMIPAAIRKVCSDDEVKQIETAKSPNAEFCRIWSIKEAVSKLGANGIFRDIRNVSGKGLNVNTMLISNNKYMSAASSEPDFDFSITELHLEDLLYL